MNRSMTHTLATQEARLAQGISWQVVWGAWLFVCGLGCSGCYQSTVVPPTTSIAPPMRPAPIIPLPTEPYSPPTMQPIEPITRTNPWKPDSESREWNYIVLHHTASDSGSVDSIHEEHLKRKDKNGKNWLGIGYHFVIGNGNGMGDGEIEPTFRWRQQMQGAHAGVADFNQHGIGIVLVGNFEKTPPTAAQLTSIKRLVGTLKREYSIVESKIMGHGDVKATECPGKLFPMSEVRESIAFLDEHAAVDAANTSSWKNPNERREFVLNTERTSVSLNNPSGDSRK